MHSGGACKGMLGKFGKVLAGSAGGRIWEGAKRRMR